MKKKTNWLMFGLNNEQADENKIPKRRKLKMIEITVKNEEDVIYTQKVEKLDLLAVMKIVNKKTRKARDAKKEKNND